MNLLISGAFALTDEIQKQIENMGHTVVFMSQEKDALPCDPKWVEGVICNGLFLYHPIEKFEALRFIQLTSAGFDRAPMEYIQEKGIEIYNARGVYNKPMAEFALWGVLSLFKKARFFENNQRLHKWEKNRALSELGGKTLLVVGCGSVGTACASVFGALGCKVWGADISVNPRPLFEKIFPVNQVDAALKEADIVILTLPLTEETKGFFGEKKLSLMKKGSVLVNISRGGVVDTAALENALEKHLGGAVLDVFESEPLPEDSRLWDMENVIVTPHNSFVGEGNGERLLCLIMKNLENTK